MNTPDLPVGAIVTPEGYLSDLGITFFQQLVTQLQTNFNQEGLVSPSQSAPNITAIQNNTNIQGQKTCLYGTILYDSTDNSMRVAVDDGSGNPIFKTFTLF